jgi:hypothetical protein
MLQNDMLNGDTTDPNSWNSYTYSKNNPLAYIDFKGLAEQETIWQCQTNICEASPKDKLSDSIILLLCSYMPDRCATIANVSREECLNDLIKCSNKVEEALPMMGKPFTLLVGIGGSGAGVAPAAAEGSLGIAIEMKLKLYEIFLGYFPSDIGVFMSGAMVPAGFNISSDLFAGAIKGDVNKFKGPSQNLNVIFAGWSFSLLFADKKNNLEWIGFTIGAGPGIPYGLSISYGGTEAITFKDTVRFIKHKLENDKPKK